MGFARVPNGSGPFIIQQPTFSGNNNFAGLSEVRFFRQGLPPPGSPIPLRETISSLRNTGAETATLEYAFIAARNPGEDNVDFGEAEQGTMLGPGDAVDISSSIVVDRAGIWSFWPCYYARAHSGELECPDEWRRFEVAVQS